MDHYELVEKLREKANVSYEEAKIALEACDWDLLDALVYLENEGKLAGEANYSTEEKKQMDKQPDSKKHEHGGMSKLLTGIGNFLKKTSVVTFDVERGGKNIISLPLIAFALLLLFLFWWVIGVLILGLFFGFRYAFHGMAVFAPVNDAMNKASDAAENIKQSSENNEDK